MHANDAEPHIVERQTLTTSLSFPQLHPLRDRLRQVPVPGFTRNNVTAASASHTKNQLQLSHPSQ